MKWAISLVAVTIALISCSPTRPFTRQLVKAEEKYKDHIGFMVYDPIAKKTILEYQANKYFTPASNTKIVTFYTALQILGDSVPALKYTLSDDSLIFSGTGDPSFLYRNVFNNGRVYDFLKNARQSIFYSPANFETEHFGSGWAWDDYHFHFSAERSSLPLFGNLVSITKLPEHSWTTVPPVLENRIAIGDSVAGRPRVTREIGTNQFTFHPGKEHSGQQTWELPFHWRADEVIHYLSDTLKRSVIPISNKLRSPVRILNSIPVDSLYRVMMQDSDNFIAEQLLLLCAGMVSDTLNEEITIRYAMKNFLFDLPDKPVWVDGSGLSRYNLFTPRSIVRVWEKIYQKVDRDRLFSLLAVGGETGTLKNWYAANRPYVFGKTGSLSNNHSLSGFLVTNKGNVLIFSFMNANFVASSNEVRKTMEEFLISIRDKY